MKGRHFVNVETPMLVLQLSGAGMKFFINYEYTPIRFTDGEPLVVQEVKNLDGK